MKVLYVTAISLTMNAFFVPHIKMLVEEGHQVDLACNFTDLPLAEIYSKLNCQEYQIDFSRQPLSTDNIKACKQLKKLIENGGYDIVHCHTPNAAAVTRLVCRKFRKKTNLKVFYTAHGFHFYRGAPLKNWLLYYPVEWLCARWTDTLITINKEDYELAKKHMRAKKVEYVPGVGLDLSRFENISVDRTYKRREIGVPENAFLLLSVGELNKNKNHQVIIKAIANLKNPNIHYAVAGVGNTKDYLLNLAENLGVSRQLHLLGYRDDIPEVNCIADAFCFPSRREGLGLAALEAMACGLPIVCADNRGTKELVSNGENGLMCAFDDAEAFKKAIGFLIDNPSVRKEMGEKNLSAAERFNIGNVLKQMKQIYTEA